MTEKRNYEYVLITSQYYHSRHSFIVKYDKDTFLEDARALVTDLFALKRAEGYVCRDRYPFGDLDDKFYRENGSRHNINDAGDIYFIKHERANYLSHIVSDYDNQSRLDLKHSGYDKRTKTFKNILAKIEKHHNYRDVVGIVMKHFEVA